MAVSMEISAEQTVPHLLERISGRELELSLVALSRFGGEMLPDGHWAVTREAFTPAELASRAFLQGKMLQAGMGVEMSPFAVIGMYLGKTNKAPVDMVSHFDSVPQGGMYDGTTGVTASIEVIRLLHESGILLPRPLRVIAFTGEESSRFQLALMGSRGTYFGLSEDEVASRRPGDISIKEALQTHWPQYDYHQPYFGYSTPAAYAALELHVSQDKRLADKGVDLGIVEAIAAPDRFQIEIGTPIGPDTLQYSYARHLEITIKGIADHSGATPMGPQNRADGLVVWSKLLNEYLGNLPNLTVASVEPEGQALNKIPGRTQIVMRVVGYKEYLVNDSVGLIYRIVDAGNKTRDLHPSRFDKSPISIEKITEAQVKNGFFPQEQIMPRHLLAARAIQIVSDVAESYNGRKVVGTVGTFHIAEDGRILLGVDIRGVDLNLRTRIVQMIQDRITSEQGRINVQFHQLPGSSEPTSLDPAVTQTIVDVVEKYKIGSYERTYSPAGHDIQTLARTGIPTGLIFIPSRNEGISHSPLEYSTPEDLARGAKALAAAAIKLAYQ